MTNTTVTTREEAQILKLTELKKLRRELPKSWIKAAGMLRHRRKALLRHLQRAHAEWERE